MLLINRYRNLIGKTILILILGFWFLSLIPGLILESRHIKQRFVQFGNKNPEEREKEVMNIELNIPGEGEGYMIIKNYLENIRNGSN